MREFKSKKTSFIKKILIKICRIFDYELIDQSNLDFPVSNKEYEDQLSKPGNKSITLGLGETTITRKAKTLDIIVKICTSVHLVSQTKKRIFEENKSEYTFRTINSLMKSTANLNRKYKGLEIKFTIIDVDSPESDINKILSSLSNGGFKAQRFTIEKNNDAKNHMVSTMASILKSFEYAKNCEDLIYFVEDDYLHKKNSIKEMIFTYERISSQINREIIICPADYPYLYTKAEPTLNFLGHKCHWRKVGETLCTFLTSKQIIEKYWDKYISMCLKEHAPFEKPMHEIYEKELCISPIPSLAIHFTNINSIFGLSPNVDWKKIWDENEV